MSDFIRLLLAASEKAANIARAVRREERLFKLLIEEKEPLERQHYVVRDFKTLADVLIQETVRYEISSQFPEIAKNIYGEESNLFTNSNEEGIEITVGPTEDETRLTLEKVLLENPIAARLLAREVHQSVTIPDNDSYLQDIPSDVFASYSNLGIWIDPIDATSEYIKGGPIPDPGDEERILSEGGLPCATVLIGVFQLDTASSVFGVINQPFWKFTASTNTWIGRQFWGVCVESLNVTNLSPRPSVKTSSEMPVVMMSESESVSFKAKLSPTVQIVHAPGAGYKLLCVILGLADFYILSKHTTHFWDTCAPHAILKALGGGIENLEKKLEDPNAPAPAHEILYPPDDEYLKGLNYANVGGIFGYRDKTTISDALNALK